MVVFTPLYAWSVKIYNPLVYRISKSTKKSLKVSLIIKFPDSFFYLGDELHFKGMVISSEDLLQAFGKKS